MNSTKSFKKISALLIVIMLTGIIIVAPGTLTNAKDSSLRYGDVNGDGSVNSTDYALMKRYILGTINEFPVQYGLVAADVNADGSVNSTDYALMKRYILGIIDRFPAEDASTPTLAPPTNTPVLTPEPTEPPGPYPTPNQPGDNDISCKKGNEFYFVFNAYNATESAIYKYKVNYNPNELEVVDLCSETFDRETQAGKVQDTSITIDKFSANTGEIVFSTPIYISEGKKWTGSVNSIKFKSNITGHSNINYSVEIVPIEDKGDPPTSDEPFNKEIEIKLESFLVGGQNFHVFSKESNKIKMFKTRIRPKITLVFYENVCSVDVIGNAGERHYYESFISKDRVDVLVLTEFMLIAPENQGLGLDVIIHNNSEKHINVLVDDKIDRAVIMDRNGNPIESANSIENVTITRKEY
jgi:hypothetical protein